ncbi:MAG: hypothetical protein ACLFM1_07210 [Bacteroidales bacterium]
MMKYILLTSILITLLIFGASCSDDNIDSGIKGYVEYGEVDCSLDQVFWNYEPYNGMVYVINTDSVSSNTGNYKAASDSAMAEEGEFIIGVKPGHYHVFIEEYQVLNSSNEVTVYLNQTANPDFSFYTCQ